VAPLKSKKQPPIVHFIGIGGIGISALARWFSAQKWAISGSDVASSVLTGELKREGFKLKIGHKKGYLSPKTALVVYNSAIPADNPELLEARRLGLPVFTYPELLGRLTKIYPTIAVAGAHGKSTSTSLLSLVLVEGGLDPTVIVGTKLKEFGGKNFRLGQGEYLLIEADEFKGSFWQYSPAAALITNIDWEHLDFYKNFKNVKKSFLRFIGNISEDGSLVVNRDNAGLWSLRGKIAKIAGKNKLKVVWYSLGDHRTKKIVSKIGKILKIPGRHNVSNSLGVYLLARTLGIKEKTILGALGSYRGAWRRFEYRGDMRVKNVTVPVYDDYGHHPTEIKATLQAFREKFPDSKIICVFEPHQAKRLKLLFREFVGAFDGADELILLPLYKVAGRDKTDEKYSSKTLATLVAKRKTAGVTYLAGQKDLKKTILGILENKAYKRAVVVMMGAGDIVNYTGRLLR
jgi:UDP-N-acetylmuramate--alanine ligase